MVFLPASSFVNSICPMLACGEVPWGALANVGFEIGGPPRNRPGAVVNCSGVLVSTASELSLYIVPGHLVLPS